jgi:hypothetical protein
MSQRARWQYCQIEVRTNDTGVLKQFVEGRPPVATELHQNWSGMIAKLGEQGWEMIAAFPHEGGMGRRPLTYVFRRTLASGGSPPPPAPPTTGSAGPTPPAPPDEPDPGPVADFEPLRGT